MADTALHSTIFQKFLARLSDTSVFTIPAYHVTVVVAHPDEETIACGGTLERLKGAHVVVVTDGVTRRAD